MSSSSNIEYRKLFAAFNSEPDLKDFVCRYCDFRLRKDTEYHILQEDKRTIEVAGGFLSKDCVVCEMEVDNSYYSDLVNALLLHGGSEISEGAFRLLTD